MLEREQFNKTMLIDYGFAIIHFINSMRKHKPRWIFSRFELMDTAQMGSFKAHAEYAFMDQENSIHRCDIFGSELVMSSQPQSLSEEISRLQLQEVAGEIKIDRSNGDVYFRFIPDDTSDKDGIDESASHWESAVAALPANGGILTRCQVDSLYYMDLAVGHVHYVGAIPLEDVKRIEAILNAKTHNDIEDTDLTQPLNWLFNVLPVFEPNGS